METFIRYFIFGTFQKIHLKKFSELPMRFDKNNVLGPKYIDIYQFRRLVGGFMVHFTFLFIIH